MLTIMSACAALFAALSVFLAAWVMRLRWRAREREQEQAREDSLISDAPDEIEIPADLVGAGCKRALVRFAPMLGTTPVKLLRAALASGLTGGRPIAGELLDALDALQIRNVEQDPSEPN